MTLLSGFGNGEGGLISGTALEAESESGVSPPQGGAEQNLTRRQGAPHPTSSQLAPEQVT